MSKNLRIIHTNLADIATLAASSSVGDYVVDSIKKDSKSLVWRSSSGTASISGTWQTPQSISSLVLPYTNLVTTAQIRFRLYSDVGSTLLIYDSGTKSDEIIPHGNTLISQYAYGGGSYAAIYFNKVSNCRSFTLDVISAAQNFVELSRIIIGDYWSPKYNTEFGISVELQDSSTEIRTDSGDLVTEAAPTNKLLSFSLNYMEKEDRDTLFGIARNVGRYRSIHVSIFPEDEDKQKECLHQVYGRLVQNVTITHPMYTIYATSLSIQEV
jgi:hypothetical protein